MWRIFEPYQPDWNSSDISPKGLALQWKEKNIGTMYSFVFSGTGYWQGYNEPVISSPSAMSRYAEFEIERTRILSSYGLRAAIGSFAVGNPSNMGWLDRFLPAIQMAKDNGAILSLHEYNYPTPKGDHAHDPLWLSLRHRLFYEGCPAHGWAGLPQHLRIPLIITECGRDAILHGEVGGWRGCLTPRTYADSLMWYDQELQKDSYVLGACIFCVGAESGQWVPYDIWPEVAHSLTNDYGKPTPIFRSTYTILPRPELDIKDIVSYLPVNGTVQPYGKRTVEDIKFIVIHHAATPNKDTITSRLRVQRIADYHIRRWNWYGIGYHYVIDREGTIFKTQEHTTVSNHTYGANLHGIGICLLGTYTKELPTEAQAAAAASLIKMLGYPAYPHSKWGGSVCPGRAMEAITHRL